MTSTDLPDARRVLMGWLASSTHAQVLPTAPWRGQLSCARELDLATTADGTPYVAQRPIGPVTTVALDRPVERVPGVLASYDDGLMRLTRAPDVAPGWAGTLDPLEPHGGRRGRRRRLLGRGVHRGRARRDAAHSSHGLRPTAALAEHS